MTIRERALRFWTKFDRDWGWNLARLLAYTLLQALFAVTCLQIVVLALAMRLTSTRAQDAVISSIARLLPDRVESSAFTVFAQSIQSTSGWLLALALPVAVWYGSRLFAVLEAALAVIFRRSRRRFLRQNAAAMLMLVLFTVLLPVVVLSATAIPRLGVTPQFAIIIAGPRVASGPWIPWLALLAGLLANFALTQIAYTLLTPGGVSWRAAWPGALVAATLAQGYLLIFPLYARYVLHPNHFGSVLGFALVALVFLYAYGVCIVVGAEIAALRAGYGALAGDVTETMAKMAATTRPASDTSSEAAAAFPARPARSARVPARLPAAPAAASVFDDQLTSPVHNAIAPLLSPERD